MRFLMDVLRGIVIGLANVIPGVSGGTMMVSMGIYDKLIWSINHLFKKFRESIKTLFPYLVGMAVAIALGAYWHIFTLGACWLLVWAANNTK